MSGDRGPMAGTRLTRRYKVAALWRNVFRASTVVGIIVLALLLINIANSAFGYVAVTNRVDPGDLVAEDRALEDLDHAELVAILEANISRAFPGAGNKPFAELEESGGVGPHL